ncbi:MAG: hypothetical protein AB7P37_22820 [Ramlibacter sp.]
MLKMHISDPLFWVAALQWTVAFPLGRRATDAVSRVFAPPLQMLLVSMVMLAVACAVFLFPLLLTGNLPLPCCERFDSYKYGTGVGIGLLVAARLYLSFRA